MPVVIHTRTGVCRGFGNFDLAYLWLREQPQNEKYIFTAPEDFQRINVKGREILIPRLSWWSQFRWGEDRVPQDLLEKDQETQNKLLWYTVNLIADPVTRAPPWLSRGEGTMIDLDLCKELLKQDKWKIIDVKYPDYEPRLKRPGRQLRAIVQELLFNDNGFLREPQLEKLMSSSDVIDAFKTRQDGWRIFRYYRPVLEQLRILR